jgi:hypothetical protein
MCHVTITSLFCRTACETGGTAFSGFAPIAIARNDMAQPISDCMDE